MNNSIVKYLLITGVIVVWGLIISRVVSSVSDNAAVSNAEINLAPVASFHPSDDTFALYANYPDPFLAQNDTAYIDNIRQAASSVPSEIESSQIAASKEAVPLPDPDIIRFAGVIINPSTKSKMAIISLNGKEILIQEGRKSEGINVLNIYNDHVIIKFKSRKMNLSIE